MLWRVRGVLTVWLYGCLYHRLIASVDAASIIGANVGLTPSSEVLSKKTKERLIDSNSAWRDKLLPQVTK